MKVTKGKYEGDKREIWTKWRFIDTGEGDSAANMAIDEAILIAHHLGCVPPTIRFYTWKPATLTLGYFQKAKKEIDLAYVKKERLGVVRRMTGGRAVLHDHELTYTVVISETDMPTSVTEAYRIISEGLLYGFQKLGLRAAFAVPQNHTEQEILKRPRSSVCFDAPSWYELVVEGRKVTGSAQTRQRGVILQHGSIPLSFDLDQLYNVFQFPSDAVKQRLKRGFEQKAVAINSLRDQPATIEEVKSAFRQGFEQAVNQTLKREELTPFEVQKARELVVSKYARDEWNYKR